MTCVTIRERYTPILIQPGGSVKIDSNALGGFLCSVTGTLSITVEPQDGKPGYVMLTDFPVTAGQFVKLPFYTSSNGMTVTSTDAAGVLGVA